jgi:hypothetical protein
VLATAVVGGVHGSGDGTESGWVVDINIVECSLSKCLIVITLCSVDI